MSKSPNNPTLNPQSPQFPSTKYLLQNYPKKQIINASRQLIRNLQSISMNKLKKKKKIEGNQEYRYLEGLEREFDCHDLREEMRETGTVNFGRRAVQNISNKTNLNKNNNSTNQQQQTLQNPNNNNSQFPTSSFQKYLQLINQPQITTKLQKQKLPLQKQILLKLYSKIYQQITKLHQYQKQLFYRIYHHNERNDGYKQQEGMEGIRMEFRCQERDREVVQEKIQGKYGEIRELLVGVFRNGFYMANGLEGIIQLMAYTDKFIKLYQKQCQGIIQGTYKLPNPHNPSQPLHPLSPHPIYTHYKTFQSISLKPSKNQYPEILDEKSKSYLNIVYQHYLQDNGIIENVIHYYMKSESLVELVGSRVTDLNKIKREPRMAFFRNFKDVKRKGKGKINKERIQSRLGMVDDDDHHHHGLKQEKNIQQIKMQQQRINFQSQLVVNQQSLSTNQIASSITQPMANYLSSSIRQTLNSSLLDTKLRTKDDVQNVYQRIKVCTLPNIFNMSRIRKQDDKSEGNNSMMKISKNSSLQKQQNNLEHRLIQLRQHLNNKPTRYQLQANTKSIQSINLKYKNRISLPIINSQIKISHKSNNNNNNQPSILQNTIKESLKTQENQSKLREAKLSEKRRIKKMYTKEVYGEVYKLLFGIQESSQ